ncbi:putative phosphomannomutase, partial [Haemophilus influenzae]
WRTLNCSPFRH